MATPEQMEQIASDIVEQCLPFLPPATNTLDRPPVTPPPCAGLANWRDLPDDVLEDIFSHLPVLDIFELAFLFSDNWFDIWRRMPLFLHDEQLLPTTNAVAEITQLLNLHQGLFPSLRVDSTTWDLADARRWCEALHGRRARELVLVNRYLPHVTIMELPEIVLDFADLDKLYLAFFNIPGHARRGRLPAFLDVSELGFSSCTYEAGFFERLVFACNNLDTLTIGHSDQSSVSVRSDSLKSLKMWMSPVRALSIEAPCLEKLVSDTRAEVFKIHGVPVLADLMYLDLRRNEFIQIEGIRIQVGMHEHPQIPTLTDLVVVMHYLVPGDLGARMLRELLKCFPRLERLTIWRKEVVEEGYISREDDEWYDVDLFSGIECVTRYLNTLMFEGFYGGKSELGLIRALLLRAGALDYLNIEDYGDCPEEAIYEMKAFMRDFVPLSRSLRVTYM